MIINKSELNQIVYRKLIMKCINFLFWGVFGWVILFECKSTFAQQQEKKFEKIHGTFISHNFNDQTDDLSSQLIIGLIDDNGIPLWFSREFIKQVCSSGECKLIHLKIYWDGAANYLGIKPLEPLTKTNHVQFTEQEYKKLDNILADSLSILKGLNIEELTIEKNQVDGITGATLPYLSDLVVPNAVYTCYTLWHTVYGPTQEKIKSIIEQRVDGNYLKNVFNKQDPKYLPWAIDFVDKHPEYHKGFYREILKLVKSDDQNLCQKAVRYFTPFRLADVNIQKELAVEAGFASLSCKYKIMQIFSSFHGIDDHVIMMLLNYFEKNIINAGMLGSVCNMISHEHLRNPDIVKELNKISGYKNIYVRKMVQEILTGNL